MDKREMVSAATTLLLLCCFFLLPRAPAAAATATATASPSPACAGSGSPPVTLGEPLRFCGYTGISCCDAVDDDKLREELDAMNVPDAAIVKAFLCARYIPSLSPAFNTSDTTTAAMKLSVALLCGASTPPSSTSAPHQPITATTRSPAQEQQDTMCVERISTASFQTMTAHPDGSGRVFLSTRDGKIWLATMPRPGSGAALRVDGGTAHPFLDLTDRVHHDAVLGLVGVAFHPEFATNGRVFVSYNCDCSTSPACGAGRCWGAAGGGNGTRPCRYQLVVAEFSADGGPDYSKATRADPYEVRRIFSLGLPQPHKLYSYQTQGGQILFRPGDSDGYLYLITGGHGDFSKNGRSLFGKIMRCNVGSRGKPQIFAPGLNNPSACTFDSDTPSHLFCADVNEQLYERVYLVTEGASYGRSSSSNTTVSLVIDRGRPADGRMPSIVGGLVYRGSADASLNGRYLYVYSSGVWTDASTQALNVRCSVNSPVPCRGIGIGHVLSLGEDNSKDAFFLTTGGVFRVVPPGACRLPTTAPQPPPQWPPGTGWVLSLGAFALLFALYMVWSTVSGGGHVSIFNG